MVIFFHETAPNQRDLDQVCAHLAKDGVVACPTSSGYALLIQMQSKSALEHVKRIRKLEKNHLFTIFCKDLAQISTKAIMDDPCYRLIKRNTPSVCTFILRASKQISKQILHPKRKSIGVRIPVEPILISLLQAFGQPLLSVSFEASEEASISLIAEEVADRVGKQAMVLDVGRPCAVLQSTIIDCTQCAFEILRQGQHEIDL